MDLFSRWFFGLGIFALGIGWLSTFLLLNVLRSYIKTKAAERKEMEVYDEFMAAADDIPSWLIGLAERTFFAILVAFNVSATAVAMIVWVVVRMLYNWNILWRQRENITIRSLALSDLLGSIVSMLFALIGGLICRGSI
jgi:hypothetical protein